MSICFCAKSLRGRLLARGRGDQNVKEEEEEKGSELNNVKCLTI
jgi:hypothetical protein